jgi:O-antigen/teichoic acid export membrane protein
MNRYKKLLSNTVIFAVGTFSSKVLVFLLMPFYTRVLSDAEYGTVDLIVQTSNLLLPLATVGINNAVIRFGLERQNNPKSVFSIGLLTILGGFLVVLLLSPIINSLGFLDGYSYLVFIYVFTSSIHNLCAQFCRSRGYVKLYAIDGIFNTCLTIFFNIMFLAVFHFGIVGYVLATILSDFIQSMFLIYIASLWKFFSLKAVKKTMARNMLKYSVPLIPTTICTWIVNISDRYMIAFLLGNSVNGIYAVSNKIPSILTIVATIFGDAWQISAVEEERGRRDFYSKVLSVYVSVAFTVGSFLILTSKLMTMLLASPDFYSAWQYMPFLIMGTTFACLAYFMNSVYMVAKKSLATLTTTMIAAGSNLILNFFLIPKFGALGAAFATFCSYFLMFVVRSVHSNKYISLKWPGGRLIINFCIVFVQSILMVKEVPFWLPIEIILFLIVLVINLRELLRAFFKLLQRR